jgi:hypothetical protein
MNVGHVSLDVDSDDLPVATPIPPTSADNAAEDQTGMLNPLSSLT